MKALCSECASEAFEEIEEVSAQTTELTCWDVLGIPSEGATKAAINKAYRRVSIVCHPDRATDEEDRAEREEMFKELGEAREAALQEIGEK
jgi:DnaJ-class molecular chaperone